MSIYRIRAALNAAIRAAAQSIGGKSFSRKSALTAETVIRLLISAEGGCLAKILHDADIQVTASALSQRRTQIPPDVFCSVFGNFNSTCTMMTCSVAINCLRWTERRSIFLTIPPHSRSFRMTVFPKA